MYLAAEKNRLEAVEALIAGGANVHISKVSRGLQWGVGGGVKEA